MSPSGSKFSQWSEGKYRNSESFSLIVGRCNDPFLWPPGRFLNERNREVDYAKNTKVSIDSSQQEIQRLLRRAGADKCMIGWGGDCAFVAFMLKNIPVRLKVEMPEKGDYQKTETGRSRKTNAAFQAWEQACRQRMREFCLLLKAKLVSVEIGLRPIEHEFYADICLPSRGRATIFECQHEDLQRIIETGKLPALLPGI